MIRALVPVLALMAPGHAAVAQIAAANDSGVAMGHLHFFVADVEANRDFWVRLGGTARPIAEGARVELPGVVILIGALASTTRATSVVDHVAFRVASLSDIAARGFDLEPVEGFPGIASVYTPSGDRVELFEEGTATNVGFEPDFRDSVAERHNRPLTGPIASHHLHFYLPEDEIPLVRDWYVEHFGAVPGIRWRYDAADIPGMNLNFSAASEGRSATRGQPLDHIGFEIGDLEAFCARLAASGVALTEPFERISPTFARAVLTDPSGTTIELTEGL
jgi:catechol 2,3-dioxygenase-like lactoylglutathione lyase family enzyme